MERINLGQNHYNITTVLITSFFFFFLQNKYSVLIIFRNMLCVEMSKTKRIIFIFINLFLDKYINVYKYVEFTFFFLQKQL